MPVGPVHGGEELVGKFVGEGGVRKEAVPGLFDPGKSPAHLSGLDAQVAGVRQGREEEKRRRLDRPVETGEVKILNDPDPLRPIPSPSTPTSRKRPTAADRVCEPGASSSNAAPRPIPTRAASMYGSANVWREKERPVSDSSQGRAKTASRTASPRARPTSTADSARNCRRICGRAALIDCRTPISYARSKERAVDGFTKLTPARTSMKKARAEKTETEVADPLGSVSRLRSEYRWMSVSGCRRRVAPIQSSPPDES